MRAVVQRVAAAHVVVSGETVGRIGHGLLVYLGAGKRDGAAEVDWMVGKVAGLRVFGDDQGRMSRDVFDVAGELLIVPQFTLYGDVRNGRRPSFEAAAEPTMAEELYRSVCNQMAARGIHVETGRFRTMMDVHCVVDGPVTILVDSEKRF